MTPTSARAAGAPTRHADRRPSKVDALGLDHSIRNPFRLQTKGEIVAVCTDPELLRRLAPLSVSCSHPETKRWHQSDRNNCGTCYPCLIRRAAMHRAGLDDRADYVLDALTDPALLRRGRASGASLRALAKSLTRPERPGDVIANGRIPGGEAPAFFEVWQRGRRELRDWLDSGAAPALRRRYE